LYAVLGVAYAVLLGLMVVTVWQDYEAAEASVAKEANAVSTVFWLAHDLPRQPQPATSTTRTLIRACGD
jgi:hypothetical protein